MKTITFEGVTYTFHADGSVSDDTGPLEGNDLAMAREWLEQEQSA